MYHCFAGVTCTGRSGAGGQRKYISYDSVWFEFLRKKISFMTSMPSIFGQSNIHCSLHGDVFFDKSLNLVKDTSSHIILIPVIWKALTSLIVHTHTVHTHALCNNDLHN